MRSSFIPPSGDQSSKVQPEARNELTSFPHYATQKFRPRSEGCRVGTESGLLYLSSAHISWIFIRPSKEPKNIAGIIPRP